MTMPRLLSTHADGRAVLTLFHAGEVHSVTSTHPNFDEIKNLSDNADTDFADILALLDVEGQIRERIEEADVGDRVTIKHGRIHLDGEPLQGDDMSKRMVALMRKGRREDFTSLVRFIERAADNPGGITSIESLWNWLNERNVTFREDGHFIAYKGVKAGDSDVYLSLHAGTADVNGVTHKECQIPQRVGDVVTMPREKVNGNTKDGCSYGLHAGTWSYAGHYGNTVLAVSIDPMDVVAVPDDASFQKLRVCKYTVDAVVSSRMEEDDKVFFGFLDEDWT